jgi:hypothetical protein
VERPIEVPVREDFRLLIGTLREEDRGTEVIRVLEPPAVDLFWQLIDFLEAQPEVQLPRFSTYDEAAATVAVCLRWGSYFALPADRSRPLWSEARNPRVSLLADLEMKRINIEACSALEQWLELWRTDRDRWYGLVSRAVRYLPMETRNLRRDKTSGISVLSHAPVAELIARSMDPALVVKRQQQARMHPTRVFANAVVLRAWRNGPVEELHAGTGKIGPPLELCRLSRRECQAVLRSALSAIADAMWALIGFDHDSTGRPWHDQVLPYHLVDPSLAMHGYFVTPGEWSLTERTSSVELTGSEQEASLPVRLRD